MTADSRRMLAARILSLVDLTSLNTDEDEDGIRALCAQASGELGRVAAVCTWPRLVSTARIALQGSGIPIAAVSNFPSGTAPLAEVLDETRAALDAGAGEIDVVLPWRALQAGDAAGAHDLLAEVRQACGPQTLLKVILETGQLTAPGQIVQAARVALSAGADFLKTSTGKTQPGATPEAARQLMACLAEARDGAPRAGLKISGGVRRLEDAALYLDLFEACFGEGSATPANFRIGASTLMAELLAA